MQQIRKRRHEEKKKGRKGPNQGATRAPLGRLPLRFPFSNGFDRIGVGVGSPGAARDAPGQQLEAALPGHVPHRLSHQRVGSRGVGKSKTRLELLRRKRRPKDPGVFFLGGFRFSCVKKIKEEENERKALIKEGFWKPFLWNPRDLQPKPLARILEAPTSSRSVKGRRSDGISSRRTSDFWILSVALRFLELKGSFSFIPSVSNCFCLGVHKSKTRSGHGHIPCKTMRKE